MLNKYHTSRKIAYQNTFKIHGNNPKSLQWKDREAQSKRLRELIKDIDFEGKTVLDVGCGFGDIIPDIFAKTHSFEYLGVDIVPEFIGVATETYITRSINEQKNKIIFEVRDIFTNPFKNKFNIVISSGILNSLLKSENSFKENIKKTLEYRKKLITVMWNHSNEVFAFNMSGNYPQPENDQGKKIYYTDSLEILKFCFTLTNKIIFRHNYHKKDFTIVMIK